MAEKSSAVCLAVFIFHVLSFHKGHRVIAEDFPNNSKSYDNIDYYFNDDPTSQQQQQQQRNTNTNYRDDDTYDDELRTEEYCEREAFEASCDELEKLILVENAQYGRMKMGRCVRTEYGSLGCGTDVLEILDSQCSGKTSCSFSVSDLHRLVDKPVCPVELISYLEVSYRCIRISTCGSEKECSNEAHHRIHPTSGFLTNSPSSYFEVLKSSTGHSTSQNSKNSSQFSPTSHIHDPRLPPPPPHFTSHHQSSTCGSFKCPWLFLPGIGQYYTFAFVATVRQKVGSSPYTPQFKPQNQQGILHQRQSGSSSVTFTLQPLTSTSAACHELATVTDKRSHVTKSVTICGFEEFRRRGKDQKAGVMSRFVLTSSRVTTFVSTESSPIEIRASQESTLIGSNFHVIFILAYNLTGCEDLKSPPMGGWLRRNGNTLKIGCYDNEKIWHLSCSDGRWIGEIGRCADEADDVTRKREEFRWNFSAAAFLGLSNTSKGLVVVVGIGILFGFCLGFVMLTIAIVLIRRKQRIGHTVQTNKTSGRFDESEHEKLRMTKMKICAHVKQESPSILSRVKLASLLCGGSPKSSAHLQLHQVNSNLHHVTGKPINTLCSSSTEELESHHSLSWLTDKPKNRQSDLIYDLYTPYSSLQPHHHHHHHLLHHHHHLHPRHPCSMQQDESVPQNISNNLQHLTGQGHTQPKSVMLCVSSEKLDKTSEHISKELEEIQAFCLGEKYHNHQATLLQDDFHLQGLQRHDLLFSHHHQQSHASSSQSQTRFDFPADPKADAVISSGFDFIPVTPQKPSRSKASNT